MIFAHLSKKKKKALWAWEISPYINKHKIFQNFKPDSLHRSEKVFHLKITTEIEISKIFSSQKQLVDECPSPKRLTRGSLTDSGSAREITASFSLTLFLEIAVHNIVTVNLMQNNQNN